MNLFYEDGKIEVGLDEAGRGCLFGPVFTSGVIWNGEKNDDIIDSKLISKKKIENIKNEIENFSLSYYIHDIPPEDIDKYNILQSTIKGWHKCIDEINDDIPIDQILVDGPNFNWYTDKHDNVLPHICINGGDNLYTPIAAASILAKTYRDKYIDDLVLKNPELKKYDIHNNKGYGTKKHIDAIKKYGITKWHRKTFGICKNY